MKGFLAQAAKDASKVGLPLTAKVLKEAPPPDSTLEAMSRYLDEIMDAIDWGSLAGLVLPELTEAGLEGARIGIKDMKISDQGLIRAINQSARDYAHDRAAEMVGRKWVDGVMVDNPDAQYVISDSTREMLRSVIEDAFNGETPIEELQEAIRSAGAFSDTRSELIARTEVAMAQTTSNYDGWVKGGNVMSVRSILSMDHPEEDECDDNAAAGLIPIGTAFPSGHMHSPFHPRCFCVTTVGSVKGVNL